MNNVNFVKNIDNLGRIVIPMDIRRKLKINTGDVLSISCVDNSISMVKYNTLDDYKISEIIINFVESFKFDVILTNRERVIYSNCVLKDSLLSDEYVGLVKNGNTFHNIYDSYSFGDKRITGYYNLFPIVSNEGIIGSIIAVGNEQTRCYEICNLLSKVIMLDLNIS